MRGQGLDQAAQRPFQLLTGVARDLIGAARQEPGLAESIRGALGDQCEAAVAALPELAEALGAGASGLLGPETFGEARGLQALVALIQAIGSTGRPALVLLDDCQWADESMLKLLAAWQRGPGRRSGAGAGPRVMLVVAYRSDDVAAGHPLRALAASARISLPLFRAEDVRRLAESMAGPLPEEAQAVVERFSGGNPFMASAVLRGLVESGALTAWPSGWVVEPSALADVRSSRHAAALLVRRVELLPPEALHFLSVGAVVGKEFDLDFAATLAGQSSATAVRALGEARRRQIVWSKGQENLCAFVHDRLRDTVLERLPPEERLDLHRRAALLLEDEFPGRVFDIAYHFDAAGESARALTYALTAAEQARAQYALENAELQYRIAERGARSSDAATRYRVAEGLGDLLMLRGRYDEAAEHFEVAALFARDRVSRPRVQGKLGELAFKRGEGAKAGEFTERALGLLGERVPRTFAGFLARLPGACIVQALHTYLPITFWRRRRTADGEIEALAIRLLSRLSHVYWFGRGRFPTFWSHLREMNLAEHHPDTLELAQAYSEHAPAMTLIGNYAGDSLRGEIAGDPQAAYRGPLGARPVAALLRSRPVRGFAF